MRIYKLRAFAKFARKLRISNNDLRAAVEEIEQGKVEAKLDRFLVKKRWARPGKGKRGGFRFVIAYRKNFRTVFLFGFAKSDQDDLSPEQETKAKVLAEQLVGRTDEDAEIAVMRAVLDGDLEDITDVENDKA